jgi:pyruvate/2-oxoglutarate dehydrogenase complex dihydrolipoamide dehydrogenase (E3) component
MCPDRVGLNQCDTHDDAAMEAIGLDQRGVNNSRAAGGTVAALPVAKMATVPRAGIVADTRGMMKVVVNADTDETRGAALLSYDSHEVTNTVALAVRHGITATQLRDEIYTTPPSPGHSTNCSAR